MPNKDELKAEIGHVLFIDIVGYSKLLINEQSEVLQELNEIVRQLPQVEAARNAGSLIQLPAGDGMALVFRESPETPARCALALSEALAHSSFAVRMGIHSGPVNEIPDVNRRSNIAGAGINIAQRVMDCGDAGHILLSQRVADDLAHYRHWQPRLHPLGSCRVKHGVTLSLVNLYTEKAGHAARPIKLRRNRRSALSRVAALVVGGVILVSLVAVTWWLSQRPARMTTETTDSTDAQTVSEKSIAVLPFENLSTEKENAFFADGIQDEILTNLARIADLKVISRTSVMQYRSGTRRNLREIGKQLGVANLLEGSVQRTPGKVRVNAQLIDARTDAHIWAHTYDRDLADVFAIQSEIAQAIASQLRAKLSAPERAAIERVPTTNLAAYDLYLRAQDVYARNTDLGAAEKDLPETVRLLEEAVARDPNFLVAWALLARVQGNLYAQGYDHTPERLEKAHSAAQTALRLHPDSGEAHLALAAYYYYGLREYDRARQELASARRVLPNNPQVFEYSAYIDRREGRWPEATRNLEKALELDPRNFLILQQLALIYEAQARYAEEDQIYLRALLVRPGDPTTRLFRAEVQAIWHADIGPYQNILTQMRTENPSLGAEMEDINFTLCERTESALKRTLKYYPAEGVVMNGARYPRSYWEGVIARFLGDPNRAQTAFATARREVMAEASGTPEKAAQLSLLGLIEAGLGHKEEALRASRQACEVVPVKKDAITGTTFLVNLANTLTWVGDKDLALDRITEILRRPSYLSYGQLKLNPIWDPLRGDPRFEKIVANLAPREESR